MSNSKKKQLLHYNFMNKNTNSSLVMSSDFDETTSTDSDIGTSPSGTTLASPQSSPLQYQHQQQQQLNSSNKSSSFLNSSNSTNNTPVSNPNNTSLNSSIIRQHSYLNAVQLNDYKLNQQQKYQGKFKEIYFNTNFSPHIFLPYLTLKHIFTC